MKYTRFLAALLAVVMLLSFTACGGAPAATGTASPAATSPVQAAEEAVFFEEDSGIILHKWTDAFLPYQDHLNIFTQVLDPGKGAYMATIFYYVMPKPEDPDHLTAVILGSVISSTAPDATTETTWEVVKNKMLEGTELEPFTTAYGQTMWLIRESNSNLDSLPDAQKSAITALWEGLDEQIAQLEAVAPKLTTAAGKVVFTTVDLDGNPVDSSVFANSEYTMINIWGSFCAPCIGEMEDLMKMDAEMDNVQIITILGDATDVEDDTAEDAREIVERLNLTLPVYLTNDKIEALLPADAFPTSFLVDREGNPLGIACVGAVGPEKYQAWIQACIGG